MGMICGLTRITSQQLEMALKKTNELDSLLSEGPESGASYETNNLYLDKSWDGIHFLLTGKKDLQRDQKNIISYALGGEKTIDDSDFPIITYLTADKVVSVAELLNKIPIKEFLARYNGKSMKENDIYPRLEWSKDDADYLIIYFEQLKKFYQDAAKEKKAILISVG